MNESKKEIKMKGRKKEKMTERSSTKNIKRMKERFLFHLTVTIREFFLSIWNFHFFFPSNLKILLIFSHLHIKDDYGLPPFIFSPYFFSFYDLILIFFRTSPLVYFLHDQLASNTEPFLIICVAFLFVDSNTRISFSLLSFLGIIFS